MKNSLFLCAFVLVLLLLPGCGSAPRFSIEYEKFTLENGLDVILHHDTSDPITAVAVHYHVGAAREQQGKTGFAHLFEHMMFQESQNVKQDEFFQKIQSAGGTLNGFTTNDGTVYFEVVPKNALEMALWMEADRMGFLLPRVTLEAFKNQQGVVINEKRQNYDNRPYGHTGTIINRLLYPENHPYNWQVIGIMEDLAGATLEDVHGFYKKWYRPNNATLVVAGDYDPATIKDKIRKYFGEIPSEGEIDRLQPKPAVLAETRRVYYEDDFARSPELNMVFPSVEQYTNDAYALNMLGSLLSSGKKAPLYQVIVEEKKLAPSVSGYNRSQELAGVFQIRVRTFPGKNLADVKKAIFEAMEKFENDGFTEKDLDRIKAGVETRFYNGISSVIGKSFQLAQYNVYAGSPGYISKDLQGSLDVTVKDVWRVYNEYIKEKPYVLTSFVPKGQSQLAAENSDLYPVVPDNAEKLDAMIAANTKEVIVEDIPSSFDRSVVPAKGPDPVVNVPDVWKDDLANGIQIYGIQHSELPLIQFNIYIKGGMILDEPDKIGQASLLAQMLTEGTKTRTPVELEEAIDELGARISVYAAREGIVLSANCLVSRFDQTLDLAREILFEPRWDENEFDRLKTRAAESIRQSKTNPATVASNVLPKLIYGHDHKLAMSVQGTEETVSRISLDDLKNWYESNFSPTIASVGIVGDINQTRAIRAFRKLENWEPKEVRFPELPRVNDVDETRVYFVDFPGARQSQIRAGHITVPAVHPDYYKLSIMNYRLGGAFNSVLNMILREEKGWTYGARSSFSGSLHPGIFSASSGVQADFTFESMEIVKDAVAEYRKGIQKEYLDFTKDALIKSNALRFETIGALMGMLQEIMIYDRPFDYVKEQEDIVHNMTLEGHRKLANTYLKPDNMIYLVVGDANAHMRKLRNLGYGRPILLDIDGNLLD